MVSRKILVNVATPDRVRDSQFLLVELSIVNTLEDNLLLERVRIRGRGLLQEVIYYQNILGLECSVSEGQKMLAEVHHDNRVFKDVIVVPRTADVVITLVFKRLGRYIEKTVRVLENVRKVEQVSGWYRADGHVHSDYSGDCSIGVDLQVEAGFQSGLDVLIFTEHGDHFDKEHPKFYNGKGSWLDQRKVILESSWPLIVCQGLEVTTNPTLPFYAEGNTHVLCWNMKEPFLNPYNSPFGGETEVVNKLKQVNPDCLVGAPHPGLPVYSWGSLVTGLHVVEVFSVLRGLDSVALEMWDGYHREHLDRIISGEISPLVAVGNSDAHSPSMVGRFSNWFKGEATEVGFYEAVRRKEVVAVNGLSWARGTLNGYPMGSVVKKSSKYVIELEWTVEEGYEVYQVVLVDRSQAVTLKPFKRFEVSGDQGFIRVIVHFKKGNRVSSAVLQPWLYESIIDGG